MISGEKRGPGRPAMPPEDRKRNNMTMRLRDTTRAALERAAAKSGRSTSEEIEYRVEQSLAWDGEIMFLEARQLLARKLLGTWVVGGARAVVRALLSLEKQSSLEDPYTFEAPDKAEIAQRRDEMFDMVVAYIDPDDARDDAFFERAANYLAVVAERHRAARTKPEPEREGS